MKQHEETMTTKDGQKIKVILIDKYNYNKEKARETAKEWQTDQTAKSWGEIATECDKLHKLAKYYGLINEFKQNGII